MRDRPNDRHRHVIPVKPGDIVDHVDENKANNAPDNLRAMSRADHTRMHNKARPLSKLRSALRMEQEKRKLY